MFHDEDVEVYLNGTLVVSAKGWNNNWDDFSIPAEKFKAAIKEGDNVIAVKVIQKTGGQYIDVGLSIDVDWTGQTQGK
jgi:archaellum component FlaF (FlaF/FlaG flagellin family)